MRRGEEGGRRGERRGGARLGVVKQQWLAHVVYIRSFSFLLFSQPSPRLQRAGHITKKGLI